MPLGHPHRLSGIPEGGCYRHRQGKPVRLLTNNPKKVKDLTALGVPHIEQVKHVCGVDDYNLRYLKAKRDWGHQLGEDDLSTEATAPER